MSDIIFISFNKLEISPLNVRQVDPSKEADKELLASIEANGILQNLIVHETKRGKFGVAGGGRRFAAVGVLVKAGKLPKDFPIPCRVAETEAQAMDWSLAENFARAGMHPADTVEAFKKLAERGKSEKAISAEFGVSPTHVKRVLKLAGASPVLMTLFREGKLDMEQMQAFVLADTHESQERVYDSLKKRGPWALSANHIREHIAGEAFTDKDRLVKAVTMKAYKAAGGTTTQDLFQNTVYINDGELLLSIAEKLLQTEADRLVAEGWKWADVIINQSYIPHGEYRNRLQAEAQGVSPEIESEMQDVGKALEDLAEREYSDDWTDEDEATQEALTARYDELEQIVDNHRAFTADQKASSGVVVYFNESGQLAIEYGRQKAEDVKAARRPGAGETQEAAGGEEGDSNPEPVESAALRDSLKQYRLQAMQAQLAQNPVLAFDLMVFSMAEKVLGKGYGWEVPLALSIEKPTFDKIEQDTKAGAMLEALASGLNLAWQEHDTSAERLLAFMQLSSKAKHQIMAVCVAAGLRDRDENAAEIGAAMGFQLADYWQPTPENYFSRLKAAPLLGIGQTVIGADWHDNAKKLKKKDLVAALAENPAMAGWMPASMI